MGRVDDYPTAVKNYCRKNGIGLQEDEQLVEPGNLICPFYGGDELFGTGKPWITAKGLYLKTGCSNCGRDWISNYKYVGWQQEKN